MAIVKKGSRKIVVDDVAYRWTIRRDYNSADDPLVVAIEKELNGKKVLLVYPGGFRPDGAFADISLVTPKDVEKYIRSALEKGWTPEKNGSADILHNL